MSEILRVNENEYNIEKAFSVHRVSLPYALMIDQTVFCFTDTEPDIMGTITDMFRTIRTG